MAVPTAAEAQLPAEWGLVDIVVLSETMVTSHHAKLAFMFE